MKCTMPGNHGNGNAIKRHEKLHVPRGMNTSYRKEISQQGDVLSAASVTKEEMLCNYCRNYDTAVCVDWCFEA